MSTVTEDPRRTRSRARVLETAIAILRECGQPGLTIEAVAARSGVAKTTIYRHFADRDELHVAAVHAAAPDVSLPHTCDLVADVTAFCNALNRKLRHADFGPLLATAIDSAERSESLAAILAESGAQRRAVLSARLQAAKADGSLAPDVDVEMLNGQLVGALFYRRFISRQATGPAYVTQHVQALLSPLVRPPCESSAAGGARPR